MIIMNLKLDNIYSFKEFEINFSYPKKLVNSKIPYEYLEERPNFRFKRVNIICGSNASGKTILGLAILNIHNFLYSFKNSIEIFSEAISCKEKNSFFEIDFVDTKSYKLWRVKCIFEKENILELEIKNTEIKKEDRYETVIERFDKKNYNDKNFSHFKYNEKEDEVKRANRLSELFNKINYESRSGWFFEFPINSNANERNFKYTNFENFKYILTNVLKTFDNSIDKIEESAEVENTFHIVFNDGYKLVIQDNKIPDKSRLSTGTEEAILLSAVIENMISDRDDFEDRIYYIDEKFAFVNSELEISILSTMIELLPKKGQLFFTTHNSDVFEMDLPKHSFTFLRKFKNKIEAIKPEKIIFKNDRKLKNYVENDIFNTLPNTELLDNIIYEYIKNEEVLETYSFDGSGKDE